MNNGADPNKLPEFPRLGGKPSSVKLQRDWTARAWTGSPQRLVQLQNEVENALFRAYEQATKGLAVDDGGRQQARRLGALLQAHVRATGNGGKLSRSGELSAILAETDASDIETLLIANSAEADIARISLLFQRNDSSGSVTTKLTVSGRDRSWVGGTAELLSTEVAKGVPKWAGLRHGFVAVALGVLLSWGTGGVLMATVADRPRAWIGGAIVFGIMGGAVVGLILTILIRRLLPGFEIVEPGASNAGKRALAGGVALIGLLLSIAGVVLGVLAL